MISGGSLVLPNGLMLFVRSLCSKGIINLVYLKNCPSMIYECRKLVNGKLN